MSTPVTMTTAEYAAHRDCSDSYIRRMRRLGNLVLASGDMIDVAASDEKLDGLTNPVRGGKRPRGDDPGAGGGTGGPDDPAAGAAARDVITVQEAVRRERLARARLAELELGESAGQLTRVEEVNRAVITLVRQALSQLQGMRGRLAQPLAAESDVGRIGDLIDADVAHICHDMRAAAARLLSGERHSSGGDDGVDADDADLEQPA